MKKELKTMKTRIESKLRFKTDSNGENTILVLPPHNIVIASCCDESYAKEILMAINSHDALLEAGKDLLSEWYKQKHAVPFEFDKLFNNLEKTIKSEV